MSSRQIVRELVTFGTDNAITGELAYDDHAEPLASVLLVCPHPFMGGNMENNVIKYLAMELPEQNCVTLRFNYAPVPEKELTASMTAFWQSGHAPQDTSLAEDSRTAAQWLMQQFDLPVVIIGYSFGAYVAATLLYKTAAAIVLIAPTVTHHDMAPLQTAMTPKLLIYSNNDFATSQLATEAWFADLAQPKQKQCLINGDHFFKGQEPEIASIVACFLSPLLAPKAEVVL